MTISPRVFRAFLVATILGAGAAGAAGAAPEEAGFAYRVTIEPPEPRPGETFSVAIYVEGLSAAGLEIRELRLSRGLELESQSLRPRVAASEGKRGSECRLELVAREAGELSIALLVLEGREGRLSAGPILVRVEDPTARSRPLAGWRWKAPLSVRRHEAFAIELEPVDGAAGSVDASASFSAPGGLALEALRSLVWIATALEEGELRLPVALISEKGKPIGRAEAASIASMALPPGLAPSRAIGEFSLRTEVLGAGAVAGEAVRIRLVLEGRGNLPAIELPAPRATLDGATLAREAVSTRRADLVRPFEAAGSGGYEGADVLEIEAIPPSAGRLVVDFPRLRVLGLDGRLAELAAAPFAIEVAAGRGSGAARGGSPRARGGFGSYAAVDADLGDAARKLARATPRAVAGARAARSGSAPGGMEELPSLLQGRGQESRKRAIELLARAPDALRDEAAFLEAFLRWEGGERGSALALLYGILRRNPTMRGAAEAALACSGELGSGPPLLDALPPPASFAIVSGIAIILALGFAAAARLRSKARRAGRGRRPVLAAIAAIAAFLALVGIGLASASIAERGRRYAVAWTDSLLAVPSPLAEGRIALVRGVAGRVRGEAPGYVGLVLADGSSGWVPRESVHYY